MRTKQITALCMVGIGLWLAGTSACSGPGASPTPTQVLGARLQAFTAARSVHMDGYMSLFGTTYRISLTENDRSQAEGSVVLNQAGIELRWTGGQLFLQGQTYFANQHVAFGNRWILAMNDKLVELVRRLSNRPAFARALAKAAGTDVQQEAGPQTGGVTTSRLTSPDLTATVPNDSNAPPVRVVTAPDVTLADDLSGITLDLSGYGQSLTVAAPAPYLDLGDLDTFPPHFTQVTLPEPTFSYDDCDANGCTLSATVVNDGGKAGSVQATFSVLLNGTLLGSCTVDVPQVGHNDTARVGCRVDWNRRAGASQGRLMISNPPV